MRVAASRPAAGRCAAMHASSTAAAHRARWAGSGSAPGGLGAAGMHAAGACGKPVRVLAPVDTKRNVAAADKGPGFIVYNKTEWPLNISLDQVRATSFLVTHPF